MLDIDNLVVEARARVYASIDSATDRLKADLAVEIAEFRFDVYIIYET